MAVSKTSTDSSNDKSGHRARMRKKMLNGGASAFHDYELLEFVLGLAIPRRDTKALAKALIAEFGTYSAVLAADTADLKKVDGLGEGAVAAIKFVQASAVRFLQAGVEGRPVLAGWSALTDYLHAEMAHSGRERFRVLYLDSKNVLIRDELLSEGTVNQTSVYVREIIKRALDLGATAFILVHNHPSGDAQPSRDDIRLTGQIRDVARGLGLVVHDHVVIGRDGHSSFKQLGLL